MILSAFFKDSRNLWKALWILPFAPSIFNLILILIFWFLCSSSALANPIFYDENEPYQIYNGMYQKGYCLQTYDILGSDDTLYTCKKLNVFLLINSNSSYPSYDPAVWGRHNCWQYTYSNQTFVNNYASNGIILKNTTTFSYKVPPSFDSNNLCVKKSDISPPQMCDINIRSIIDGAFSNKFPLDLFAGFGQVPAPPGCPAFTISGQTFQLCYINQLVRVLKYVLLLVFVISSVVAL